MTHIQPMIDAARAGGKILANYFGEALDIEEKREASDVRTKADTEAEQVIISVLQQSFPDYSIYAEETGKVKNDSPYQFIIDPLDGSYNFILGIPYFSVSIALTKDDEIIAGVIYQPITDKLYTAQKGEGAFADSKPIHVSPESLINRSTVTYIPGYEVEQKTIIGAIAGYSSCDVKRMLHNWSSALDLCLLAEGKIESVAVEHTPLYDIAAGKIIAREAGAIVTAFDGSSDNDLLDAILVSNNQTIHEAILAIHASRLAVTQDKDN